MSKPTILVINDDTESRQTIVALLTLSGYEVLIAEDGKKGLGILLSKQRPDLILCNISMPKLDGYGVLRAIHNIPNMSNIPFIFLSSSANGELRKAMNLGADDYLVKPTDEDLLEVISIQLKKSGRIKQQFEKGSKKLAALIDDSDNFKDVFFSSPYKAIKKVKAKQAIYMEGDTSNFVYYLAKGKIKTFRLNEEGKEMITGLYKEGDVFGYKSFFENLRRESCTAMGESELVYIPREKFLEVLQSNNDLSLQLIKIILDHLLESGDRMMKLAYNSSSKKIAQALLFYSKVYQNGQEDFPFDRRDISALAGVAKESVSRKMSYFNAKGLIKINPKNGNIKIHDHGKMDKLKS
jgi:CRP-like cAMP-binding protein/FixJ family two-component response regulator